MLFEGELYTLHIYPNNVPGCEATGKDGLCERILQLLLNGPF